MNQKVNITRISQAIFFCLAFLLGFSTIELRADTGVIEISTIEKFYDIENCLNCDYRLISDLDFSDLDNKELYSEFYDETFGWSIIGSSTRTFRGSFDGNGYTIKGFSTKRENVSYVGLFAVIEYATIRNVVLKDVSIVGRNYVGGLVGYARFDSEVSTVSVSGNIEGNEYVGGIIGDGYRSTFDTLYSEANVSAPALRIGGIIGRLASLSSLTNAHSIAKVQGYNCSRPTQISCVVGGVIGTTITGTTVSNVFFNGELYHDVKLTSIDDKTIYAKPIIGLVQNTSNTNLYYHYEQDIFSDNYITVDSLNKVDSYHDFDFVSIWGMGDTAYLQQANVSMFLPKIESIVVSQLPEITEFDEDEVINLNGLQVKVLYDDETEVLINDDEYEIIIDRENNKVRIIYEEFETTFDIIINPVFYYTISLAENGYGGSSRLSMNDSIIDLTQNVRQDSRIDISHDLHTMGRIGSVTINGLTNDSEFIYINSNKNIEINYYLLGDNVADGVLNIEDLQRYPSLLKSRTHNKTTDTNEDNETTIADFVTLRTHIIDTETSLVKSFEINDSVLSFELVEYMFDSDQLNVSIIVNSHDVGAFYLSPVVSNSVSWSVTSGDTEIIFDDNMEALIISPKEKDSQLSNSIILEFYLNLSEPLEFTTFTLSDIQFSDSSGLNTIYIDD